MSTPLPETQYARSGDLSIAYQVVGRGDIDLIMMPALIHHVEFCHELPGYTEFLHQLSTFARVIVFDKRGQGMSDRITTAPSLAERADDIRAVMDAASSKRAALLGCSDGASMACFFAATHPETVSALILFGAYAKAHAAPDYPHMPTREERMARLDSWQQNWGKGTCLKALAPELWEDRDMRELYGKWERLSGTPSSMRKYFDVAIDTDIRPLLPTISAPTLVMHRSDDRQIPSAAAKHLAASIRGARFVDLGTGGHLHWTGDRRKFAGEIQEFLTGTRATQPMTERVLATVMITDIVNSTAKLAELGDAAWRKLLDNHDGIADRLVRFHRGRIVKNTGDGLLATFDGPGRAIRCALDLSQQWRSLNIETRVGLHTGEIELRDKDIAGIAVNIAARIVTEASPNEIVASRIVGDLVAGSDLCRFAEKGDFALKGIPSPMRLLSALP